MRAASAGQITAADCSWSPCSLALLQHGLNSLRIILNNTFEQKVIFDLRSDLYSHISDVAPRWFDNRATGDLMTRILEDVNSVERMLIDGIEQGVVALLQLVIVLGMMFYVSADLADPWLGLAPMPPSWPEAQFGHTLTAHRRYRLQRRASSAMNSLLDHNLAGIRQIKSFVREREEHTRFNAVSDQLRHATLIVMKVWAGVITPPCISSVPLALFSPSGWARAMFSTGAMQTVYLIAFLLLTGLLIRTDQQIASTQSIGAGRTSRGRARL